MSSPANPRPDGSAPRSASPWSSMWIVFVLGLIGLLLLYQPFHIGGRLIRYDQFQNLVEKGQIAKVTFVGRDKLYGELRELDEELAKELNLRNKLFMVNLPYADSREPLIERMRSIDAKIWKDDIAQGEKKPLEITQEEEQGTWVGPLMIALLPTLVLLGVLFLFLLPRLRDPMGGAGGLSNYIKSPARRYEKSKARNTFDDVAGMGAAKRELQEIVEFLRAPEKFQRLGAQVPKGVLLVGPPGTGKTLLARAVAGEAGVPFYSINGSEFIQMFVGVGASRVRDLFKTAKENAPCLVFIDEIDAVGRMRGAGVGGGSDEREQTLNQILSEMDGFQPNETVIVLASTNRPDVLDAALLRPGRFDRHITVERPNWQERLAILKVHTRNKPLSDDVDLEWIARKMIGMTGADLRNLANEAALMATREEKNRIERIDFERAADRILIGPKREEVLTLEDKRRTAYHEAGHALVTWLLPAADRPMKVSIIPRGRSLGVNVMIPEEERVHYGLEYFKAKLVTFMGGRAADRLIFGEPNAGAEMDLKQATKLARHMVTHWGMSERIGPMAFRVGEEHVFLGKEIQESRDFSDGMAQIIDEEVQCLLREADDRALELLTQNRHLLEKLAQALIQNEEMEREDIDRLLGFEPRPSRHSAEAAVCETSTTEASATVHQQTPDLGLGWAHG